MSRQDNPTHTILVVEDDPDISKLTEFVLRDRFRILTASDGPTGIEKARELLPDLILLDIYMAGMSGFEVCQGIKKDPRTADIPVIIFTAGAQKHEVSRGFAAGADDYIIKPFDPEDLIRRIEKRLVPVDGRSESGD